MRFFRRRIHRVGPARPAFPGDLQPDPTGLVALGGVLDPDLVVEAYSKAIFPWTGEHPIPWFSPDPRLILFPSELHVSRSLRKVLRRDEFEVRFDHDFDAVMEACASMPRPGQDGTWITPNMFAAYSELHRRGVTHSVETYRDGQLVGGLYGLCLGRAFCGESMFAHESNASKVALHALCSLGVEREFVMIDCQQVTTHLLSMGGVPIPRSDYLQLLEFALQSPSAWPPGREE